MSGFTGNSPGVRKALAVLLAAFAAGALGFCSRSDAAEPSGLSVSFGKFSAGLDVCADGMLLAQELVERRWLATLSTHGGGHCRGEMVAANVMAGITRTTHLNRFSVGFGAGLLVHGDVVVGPWTLDEQPVGGPRRTDGPQLCANILVRYRIGKRLVADMLHCSTGGATAFNRGGNWLAIGVRL